MVLSTGKQNEPQLISRWVGVCYEDDTAVEMIMTCLTSKENVNPPSEWKAGLLSRSFPLVTHVLFAQGYWPILPRSLFLIQTSYWMCSHENLRGNKMRRDETRSISSQWFNMGGKLFVHWGSTQVAKKRAAWCIMSNCCWAIPCPWGQGENRCGTGSNSHWVIFPLTFTSEAFCFWSSIHIATLYPFIHICFLG